MTEPSPGDRATSLDRLVDRLAVAGMSPQERGLYVRLTVAGPSKASDIAAMMQIRRPEAYRLLENLLGRGVVTATLDRPARFEAVPPAKLFEQVYRDHETSWEQVVHAQAELVPALEAMRRSHTVKEPPRSSFRMLLGRREAYRAVETLLVEASSEVLVAGLHGQAPVPGVVERPDLWDLAVRRAGSGVALRLATSAAKLPDHRAQGAQGLTVRRLEPDAASAFVVGDEREAIVWLAIDPTSKSNSLTDAAVWTNAPNFISALRHYHALVMASANDVE